MYLFLKCMQVKTALYVRVFVSFNFHRNHTGNLPTTMVAFAPTLKHLGLKSRCNFLLPGSSIYLFFIFVTLLINYSGTRFFSSVKNRI